MKRAGIYRITIDRGEMPAKFYIGQSSSMDVRWRSHLRGLRLGDHGNPRLQRAFAKYGESAFAFEVLLVCDANKSLLHFYEQAIVDSYSSSSLYNMKLQCVASSLGLKASPERCLKISSALKGLRRSAETRAKIGAAQSWKRTPEGRAKMSSALGGILPSYETRAKMSASQMGRTISAEIIFKRRSTRLAKTLATGSVYSPKGLEGIVNSNKRRIGIKLSAEHKEKIGVAQLGRKRPAGFGEKIAEANRRRAIDRAVLISGSEWVMHC